MDLKAEKRLTHPKPLTASGISNFISRGSFWAPEYMAPTRWVEHTPFLFWLMGIHQPRTFVELGTAFGYSYFAACQAVSRLSLPTKCFAVDSWRGDEQNSKEGESVYTRVRGYNDRNFKAFSTLIRMTFEEAADKFEDGSIDLMHIDAPQHAAELRTLLDLWAPKFSSRALILFHHTSSHQPGSALPQFFNDLSDTSPSFRFTHAQGLVVLGHGPDQPMEVQVLLSLPDQSPAAEEVRNAYMRLGESLVLRLELEARKQDVACQEQTLRVLQARVADQEKALVDIRQSIVWRIAKPFYFLNWFFTGVLRCLKRGPVSFLRVVAAWFHAVKWSKILSEEPLFNEGFYRKLYPDLALFYFSPRLHYLLYGWREDRVTHPLFDSLWYSQQNAGCRGCRMPPLIHYTRFGRAQGLNPSPLFSEVLPDEGVLSGLDLNIPLFTSDDPAAYKKAVVSEAENMFSAFLRRNERMNFESTEAEANVSILIVLYNQPGLTWLCLQSLLNQKTPGVELILIDNNPSNPQTEALLDRVDGARIFRNADNPGFLHAVNQGAEHAKGKYLLLLNNDAMMLPGTLDAAISRLNHTPDAGAVGGPILSWTGHLQEAGSILWRDGTCLGYGRGARHSNPDFQFVRDVDFCSGAFLMLRRNLFEDLGGLDPIYKPAYYEDTDYCVRLWEAGYRVIYDPKVIIRHFEFAGSGNEAMAKALIHKNCAVFRKKHRTFLEGQFEYSPWIDRKASTRLRADGKRILFIDDRLPYPWYGSGFPRAHKFVETLAECGHAVSLCPMHPTNGYDTDDNVIFPETLELLTDYVAGLPRLLQERQGMYDIIAISRPHNMSHVMFLIQNHPEWFRGATIIYDAEAVFSLREIRHAEVLGHPLTNEQKREKISAELSLAAYAQSVLTVTPTEAQFFRENLQVPVHVIPHTAGEISRDIPSYLERTGFLFIGYIQNATTPNGDSLRWFVQEVWPSIRRVIGERACLNIVGDCEPEFAAELAVPGVVLHGKVTDLAPYYDRARVFIAPTRFSAGLPLKAVEAAANGLPLVVSSLIANQLGWQDEIISAETASSFAEACLHLYANEAEWQNNQQILQKAVRRDYSPEAFTESVRACLSEI